MELRISVRQTASGAKTRIRIGDYVYVARYDSLDDAVGDMAAFHAWVKEIYEARAAIGNVRNRDVEMLNSP